MYHNVLRVIGGISAHLDDCAVSWLPGRSVIHVSRMYLNSSTQPAKAAKKAIAKAPKAKTKDPKAKAKAPKAKAKGPLPLAPIGRYRRIPQDSSDDEDGSSNDSEAAGTVEARRFSTFLKYVVQCASSCIAHVSTVYFCVSLHE